MKLFKKPKSKYYWYDFTVRGQRYRGSTNETKAARAANGCWSETRPGGGEHGPASEEGSCVAGVFPALPGMAGQLPDWKTRQKPTTAMAGGS